MFKLYTGVWYVLGSFLEKSEILNACYMHTKIIGLRAFFNTELGQV